MMEVSLEKLKDQELLTHFEKAIQRERGVTVEVILHIREISKRGLYAREAYPSLFSYLTEKYRYSGGAAYRRIQATKVSEIFPPALKLLESGGLNLMTISLISPHITKENAKMLIQKVTGKSKSVVEYILAELFGKREIYRDQIRKLPVLKPKIQDTQSFQEVSISTGGNEKNKLFQEDTRNCSDNKQNMEQIRVTQEGDCRPIVEELGDSDEILRAHALRMTESHALGMTPEAESGLKVIRKVKIEFVADEMVAKKLERAKDILRHKFPSGQLKDIFDQALEDLLEKRDPERRMARIEARSHMREGDLSTSPEASKRTTPLAATTRHIPERIRMEVWKRDGGRCTYISPFGQRCRERGKLELDHVKPWALGGDSQEKNLRLLCSTHNKYQAYKTFGKWLVREADQPYGDKIQFN